MPAWLIPAVTAAASLIGQGIARGKDKRQLIQQEKLGQIQMDQNKQMMDYGQGLQMKTWEETGYGAQKDQMNRAGINPGLMYGMGGGGGQTVGSNAASSVAGAQAPSGTGRESEDFAGMGMQMMAQMKLLEAQRQNIDADTANKKIDTLDKAESKTGKEYDNIIKDLMVNTDKDGNNVEPGHDNDRLALQKEIAGIDKTKSEALMNSEGIKKIQQDIELMKKQGKTQEEMAANLNKEGQLKQIEIEWAKAGLTRESLTKFIQVLILKAFH